MGIEGSPSGYMDYGSEMSRSQFLFFGGGEGRSYP